MVRAQNRSGAKLALADEYVWLVFNTSILLFFCFCSPLVTVFYSLYFSTKYIVDMQNWRKFYHARHDQPELLVGAVKLLLLASIWPQVNVTVFLLARGTWEDGTFYTSSALTLANAILLLAYRLSNYSLFYQLFPFCKPSDSDSFSLLSLKEQEERPTLDKFWKCATNCFLNALLSIRIEQCGYSCGTLLGRKDFVALYPGDNLIWEPRTSNLLLFLH